MVLVDKMNFDFCMVNVVTRNPLTNESQAREMLREKLTMPRIKCVESKIMEISR